MRRGWLAGVVLLALAGCGDDATTNDGGESAFESPAASDSPSTPEPPPLEGPATEPAQYPGGVTAEIVSVEASPAEPWVAEDQPGHDTMVRLTVKLSAGLDGYPLTVDPLGGTGPDGNLLYGPNLVEANAWAVEQEQPTMITKGSPVTLIEEFSVPVDGLEQLVYSYTPDVEFEEPWTFTGVEELLG